MIIEPPRAPVERVYRKSSVFYVINVLPVYGKRYKFGYTSKIESRLEEHRVIAPDCILIKRYRCHPANEELVLQFICRLPGVLMKSREVADLHDPRQVVDKISTFFRERDMTRIQPR